MSDDGMTAWADLHKRMASFLVTSVSGASASLQWRESSIDRVLNLRDSAGLVPVWCVQIDSCRVHKGMSQTALAFTVVNGTSQPNSLSATREFLVFEAGDKWQYIRKHADVGLQAINDLLDSETLRLEHEFFPRGATCKVEGVGCGDQAMVHAVCSQGGCNSCNPCTYCEAPREKLFTKNTRKLAKFRERSIHRLKLLAHRVEGTCPGCRLVITKENMAKLGDPQPKKFHGEYKPRKDDLGKNWNAIHRGVVYGRDPLVNLEPRRWCPCILHLNLCIVGALHKETVVKEVGIRDSKRTVGEDGIDEGSMSHQLYELFCSRNIYLKPIRKPSKSKRLFQATVQKASFHGKQAETYLSIFPEVLRLIFPLSWCTPGHADYHKKSHDKYNAYMLLWQDYKAIWLHLCDVTSFTKDDKANQLQAMVDSWLPTFQVNFPQSSYLYPHILHSHMADFIREMPVDPFFLQTQGLEHRHKRRKRIHLRVTNFSKPSANGEKCKKMARTPQAFSWVLVDDELGRGEAASAKQAAQQLKRKEVSLVKRAAAKKKRTSDLEAEVALKCAPEDVAI
jgi:hypothetical protein